MKYKIRTEEVWLNQYTTEANSKEEAANNILKGDLGTDYTHLKKNGTPTVFSHYIRVHVDGQSVFEESWKKMLETQLPLNIASAQFSEFFVVAWYIHDKNKDCIYWKEERSIS